LKSIHQTLKLLISKIIGEYTFIGEACGRGGEVNIKNMKKYLLRGGLVGLIVTITALVVVELAITCNGYCPKLSAFLPNIIWIYGSIILGGVLLGILLGFIFAKIKKNNKMLTWYNNELIYTNTLVRHVVEAGKLV